MSFPPAARERLRRLGVVTLGNFIDLPVEGIGRRFDAEIGRLHRLATGALQPPLTPDRKQPPVTRRSSLDHPEIDSARLLREIERLLESLLGEVAGRLEAVVELRLGLRFEQLGDHLETLRPAAPTLDKKQLFDLIRLRLQSVRRLPDSVVELVLQARGTPTARKQQPMFAGRSRRDMAAANRALARVRAELGDRAVVKAVLREGHLPEGHFTWEAVEELPAAGRCRTRSTKEEGRLIRRLYDRPVPLPPRPRHEPDGWMLHGLEQGPVVRVSGPYVVSGGWWRRAVHREYHFAETRMGELLWVYYDRPRRRWYLHGRVE